jgi:hypothetical protein
MSVSNEDVSFSGEEDRIPPAMLRAMQPAGAAFSLGWVMSELFDPDRRVSVTVPQPPFDPDKQLPLVADLAADPKLVYLAAKLRELLHWFPHLHEPLRRVTAQTDRKRAAVREENLATATAAAEADDVTAAEAATGALAERGFSDVAFLAAVTGLNQAILDHFADDPERLSAYQLGLALSDVAWLAQLPRAGRETPAARPSALFGLFARSSLATVQTLLNGAGSQLPAGSAAIVSRSLENWADWLDVNSGQIRTPGADTWGPAADVVLQALRVQGWVWQSVLTADAEVPVQPDMGAWIHAGTAVARTTRQVALVIARKFWLLILLALAALGALLYLVISNLNGVSQVWASLATVAAFVGSGGWSISSGVSSSLDGIGYEIWNAAKLDAAAWGVTWLPALKMTGAKRAELDRRGVAAPQIRTTMDGTS